MLAFPIRSNRRVIGVVEFFTREDRPPDDDLLRTVGTLGNQIGEFIERAKAEEEVRVRDRALASSTNGIIITDAGQPDNPIVYVNPAFERLTGYTADEAIGPQLPVPPGRRHRSRDDRADARRDRTAARRERHDPQLHERTARRSGAT